MKGAQTNGHIKTYFECSKRKETQINSATTGLDKAKKMQERVEKGGDCMKERDKKEASGLAPLSILRWILLAPVNLGLILIVQAFFIHTQTAPLTSERLAAQPVFSGCEILDIAGTEIESSKLMLRGDRSWILYRNAAGENRVMRVEWNYVLPRYRLETSVDLGIPAGGTSYTAAARDFLGKSAVTVE